MPGAHKLNAHTHTHRVSQSEVPEFTVLQQLVSLGYTGPEPFDISVDYNGKALSRQPVLKETIKNYAPCYLWVSETEKHILLEAPDSRFSDGKRMLIGFMMKFKLSARQARRHSKRTCEEHEK